MHASKPSCEKQQCVAVLKSLESAMLEANSFPNKSELELLHVTNHAYEQDSKRLKKRLLAVIRSVASRYAVSNKSTDSDSASSTSSASVTPRDRLQDEIQETTEEALESFNAALDTARGIKDAVVQPSGALGPNPKALKIGLGYLGKRLGGFLDIEKPQIHFPDYPIDNSDTLFVPPYVPLTGGSDVATATAGTEPVERHLQDLHRINSKHEADRKHPYEEEIAAATAEMTKQVFKEEDTTVFGTLEETPCTFVNTEEELFNIAERLKGVSEIAIDLENHSLRSFQGFTCLIQVSSRREDFVIDTLKLRGSINRALAPIFGDETIVKVLHGADKDVQWLERDFGIYIVNMFDTGQAARLLKLPSASLSFLLAKYCDVKAIAKKKFQLADWRQRPLPKEMFEYARSDTHYLLYVYDRLRVELSKAILLTDVWERSAKVSRRRHSKTRYDPFHARYLAARHGLGFDPRQIRILEALCKWRDATAREEDESATYVIPLHTLFGIARAGEKARTVPGLMNHGFPMRHVPPLVHKHADEITRMVSDAFDAKLEVDAVNEKSTDAHQGHKSAGKNEQGSKENRVKDTNSEQKVVNDSSLNNPRERNVISGKGAESIRRECAKLPEAKLKKLSKSAFFDSDSDSDSDDEEDTVPITSSENCNEMDDAKGLSEVRSEKSAPKEAEESHVQSVEVEEGTDKARLSMRIEDTRTKSVFDLSDSSDEEKEKQDHAGEGKSKAAQVARELQAELVEKVTNLKSTTFETELEARERERVEMERREKARKKEEEDEQKQGEIDEQGVSILGSAKWKDEARKPRQKKKRSREEQDEGRPNEPFDYAPAVQKMKLSHGRKHAERSFDPMDRLKNERSKKERKEVRRRRRGRGKSMSFMR